MGGVQKLSFHTPLTCRDAFTDEYGCPATLSNRAMHEWQRAKTPPPGNGDIAWVAKIGFPTDYLSTALDPPAKKNVTWVPAAPAGMSTVVEFLFTRDTREGFRKFAVQGGRDVLAYVPLNTGEAFGMATFFFPKKEKDFRIPASHHEKRDLIISASDPKTTGRPVRLTLHKNPKDGDCLMGWEFGGYFDDGSFQDASLATLSRTTVIDRHWAESSP
jgi:hypothetical protein